MFFYFPIYIFFALFYYQQKTLHLKDNGIRSALSFRPLPSVHLRSAMIKHHHLLILLYVTGVLDNLQISQKMGIFISKTVTNTNWSSFCQYQQNSQDLSKLRRQAGPHLEWWLSQKKIKPLHVPHDQNIPPYLSSIHQWKWFTWEEIPSGPKQHPQKTWWLLLEFMRSTCNQPAKIQRQGFHVQTVLQGWGNRRRTAELQ